MASGPGQLDSICKYLVSTGNAIVRLVADSQGMCDESPGVVPGVVSDHENRGLTNSFGVFQTYYKNVLLPDTKLSVIAWIGSVQIFLNACWGLCRVAARCRVSSTHIDRRKYDDDTGNVHVEPVYHILANLTSPSVLCRYRKRSPVSDVCRCNPSLFPKEAYDRYWYRCYREQHRYVKLPTGPMLRLIGNSRRCIPHHGAEVVCLCGFPMGSTCSCFSHPRLSLTMYRHHAPATEHQKKGCSVRVEAFPRRPVYHFLYW